jgi:pimeloyl-ACP methyl ester carboxylesterase
MPELDLPDGPLHFEAAGSGTASVLLVHGYGGSHRDWRHQLSGLDAAARCLAPDLRGHGASAGFSAGLGIETFAEDMIALADHAGAARFIVAGHSMGARTALEIMLRAPGRVAGLVLVDGSCVPDDPGKVRRDVEAEIAALGYDGYAEKTCKDMILSGLTPEDRNEIIESGKRLAPAAALDLYASMAAWDRDRFPLVAANAGLPVTVIQSTSIIEDGGWHRVGIGENPASRWLDSWRAQGAAEILTVPDTGHYITWERPGIVTDAIAGMLQRLGP